MRRVYEAAGDGAAAPRHRQEANAMFFSSVR